METKDVIIGIAIGLAIAWLFGSRQQTQPTQTISSQQLFYMQDRMNRIEQQLSAQSQQLYAQSQQLYAQFSQPVSFTTSTPITPRITTSVTTPVAAPVINTGYKNDEKWIIERGKDGHIKSLQIARDAKIRKIE